LRSTVEQDSEPVIRTEGMRKTFQQEGHQVRAVDDVSLVLRRGETLGLVGESGTGKTTLARALLGLTAADQGSVIELDGKMLPTRIDKRDDNQVRALQIVFQNPDSALNRRFSVHRILSRALEKLRRDKSDEREIHLRELAQSVRFDVRLINSRPAQLSGGLKQRVAIARAFAGEPQVVVCDEPTSALDVSVQAAILNLLSELQLRSKTSYLLISHDLGVVRYLADRIAVMYLGRIMEVGDSETVFRGPNHPYTEALLSAVPNIDSEVRARILLEGEIPSPANPPTGCVFNTRCHRAIAGLCEVTEPPLVEVEPGHQMACHIPVEELRILQRRRTTEGAGDVEAAVAKAAETTGQSVDELAESVQEAESDVAPTSPDGNPS
ncbi:MAG: oligopeptide/dipeptide ABC transporter ATP-binding protein, partial [Chloroflexota bacterium]